MKNLNNTEKTSDKAEKELRISDVSDSYSVIGRWTEPDGTEEWDVIHNGPLTYD